MENKLVSLTSADIDHEGATGTEIIVNPEYITHFHKAERREFNAYSFCKRQNYLSI